MVLVGVEETKHTVHKCMITTPSIFFEAACKEAWNKARSQIIRLPEVDDQDFLDYLHWLYTRKLDLDDELAEQSHKLSVLATTEKDEAGSRHDSLVDLYVLADILDDVELRNKCIDGIIDVSAAPGYTPSIRLTNSIWDRTSDNSTFRALILSFHTSFKGPALYEYFCKHFTEYGAEVVGDIAKELTRLSGKGTVSMQPDKSNWCRWHEHNEEFLKCAEESHAESIAMCSSWDDKA